MRDFLRDKYKEPAHRDLSSDLTPQYATLPYHPSRFDEAWEPPLPLCCTRSRVVSWEASLHTACLPFPPSSLCVPYRKDLLSDGHHVQAAVEVLNPLAQFFFPGSDQGKEVICSHHLVGAQREDASGTRQNHDKCRDKGLSRKDNSWFFQAPSLVENGPGGGEELALALLGQMSGGGRSFMDEEFCSWSYRFSYRQVTQTCLAQHPHL